MLKTFSLLESLGSVCLRDKESGIFVIRDPLVNVPFDIRSELGNALAVLVNEAFGRTKRPESIIKHVFDCQLLAIVGDDLDKVVGFSSFRNLQFALEGYDYNVLYLQGAAVGPDYQSLGLTTAMVNVVRRQNASGYTHLAARTQNVAIYILISKIAADFYPRPGALPSKRVKDLAIELSLRLGMKNFDPGIFIGRQIYEGLLTGEENVFLGANQTGLLFNQLGVDAKNGDCIIVIGELK